MFGKSKDSTDGDRDFVVAPPPPPPQRAPSTAAASDSTEAASAISAGMSITGRIVSDGTVTIFGRVEGELHAANVLIADGAHVEGEIVAEDLTIGGRVKGTVHANRVKLNGTAVVEGDIFHRSLAIEENARFEGTSRREEAVIDTKARAQGSRAQSNVASLDGARKVNGAPDSFGHTSPAD